MPVAPMQPIAEEIWNLKYRLRQPDGAPLEATIEDTFHRVANAAAAAEPGGDAKQKIWADTFYDAIADFGFLPGGRILAGAGSGRNVTLFNCFVMDAVPDDLGGIFDGVKDAALTMQMGGGIGVDFSTLRPQGALVRGIGADASGPVSFMGVWDAMCRTIMSAGARRGAMMATLRADHPDIEAFIDAKQQAGELTNFNLSVLVPDALMGAVAEDREWDLVFDGTLYRTVRARDLWDRIMCGTFEASEPGVIFIDRINARNNLSYCETIQATNPCGEQPLPPSGACLLGAMNLTRFVDHPFSPSATLDVDALGQRVRTAVRFLDNVIDTSHYPLERHRLEATAKRRMGLGLTGLADALIMCGVRYGTPEAAELSRNWMRTIQENAYLASAELAVERGAFPAYDGEAFAKSAGHMLEKLGAGVRDAVAKNGIRNGCLTTVAPTGTTSLLAGNVSSGIEPVFDFVYERRILQADGSLKAQIVEDFAHSSYKEYLASNEDGDVAAADDLPGTFVTAGELTPREHLAMQAALQDFVDSSISKTVNCPEDVAFEDFKDLYRQAFDLGLKGCTTYRPSNVRGAVLVATADDDRRTNANGSLIETGSAQQEGAGVDGADSGISLAALPNAKRDSARSVGGASVHVQGAGEVVYLSKPLERAPVLHGATYKLKWPGSEHALYVTINDVERDGRRRPFEIFINTKSLEHYSWTVALTRMISAVFRRGGDVTFVAEELQAIFDPQGGRWIEGRYVPSLQAAIGELIEGHMDRIGFHPDEAVTQEHVSGDSHQVDARVLTAAHEAGPLVAGSRGDPGATRQGSSQAGDGISAADEPGQKAQDRHRQCPRCGAGAYVRREGCWICDRCGYSQCD